MNKPPHKPPQAPLNYDMEGLLQIMRDLRHPVTGCAWDLQQDFASLSEYTIEEAYEVLDAIAKNDHEALADELGDLLLQPIFHAQIAADKGLFDFDKVVWNICDKMIRRHPHVFADQDGKTIPLSDDLWQSIKNQEKMAKPKPKYLLDDVPQFPALKHAQKLQQKAASVNFDWPDIGNVKDKIDEELLEFYKEVEAHDQQKQQQEFGDLIFSLVNYARHLGIDAEQALQYSNQKFINRFNYIDDEINFEHHKNTPLDILDGLWNDAKEKNI